MKVLTILVLLLASQLVVAQTGFSIRENKKGKKIEILYNKKIVTAYCYFDSTEKPVLFPIKTLSGITVTRGFPIAPRAGERTDHPHQVGMWLNYENVNDLDFWNNSYAIPAEKKALYGSIKYQNILNSSAEGDKAVLRTHCHWIDSKGKVLLEEVCEFIFRQVNGNLVIDRTSTLKAGPIDVKFKDAKDGLLGLRVARELEMPSSQEDTFVDAKGNVTTVPAMNNTGVTGMYVNREGITGDNTWGKRSSWTCLNGIKEGQHISIAIIDHPLNIGTPTYWHARGYGLFAANPLGRKVFTEGKEELNYKLLKNQSVAFRFRIVIHDGKASLLPSEIEEYLNDFAKFK